MYRARCAVQVLESSVNAETGLREASVVAPCPHDGVCPMQGTRSWCHFVQRFERSSLQRVTKLRQGGGLARTYQVCILSSHHAACRFLTKVTSCRVQAWQARYDC